VETVIVVEGLVKTYNGELVLDHISLRVRKGESVGIAGPNGAGKSTLLRIIAGIEPYDDGIVQVKGSIGYVPQDIILLPWRTVRGNILLAAKIRGIPRLEAEKIVEAEAPRLGLEEYLDRYPKEISGGTRRKAQILMALALKPDILLLDEPFTGLDSSTIEALQETIRRLREEYGLTIVTVSHMMDELTSISDRLILLTYKPARIKAVVEL